MQGALLADAAAAGRAGIDAAAADSQKHGEWTGLHNLGNTCYLNSVVQALYSILAVRARHPHDTRPARLLRACVSSVRLRAVPPLPRIVSDAYLLLVATQALLLDLDTLQVPRAACELSKLMRDMQETTESAVYPVALHAAVLESSQFREQRQEDAQARVPFAAASRGGGRGQGGREGGVAIGGDTRPIVPVPRGMARFAGVLLLLDRWLRAGGGCVQFQDAQRHEVRCPARCGLRELTLQAPKLNPNPAATPRTRRCAKCGHVSSKDEVFRGLELALPQGSEGQDVASSLRGCLENHMKAEVMDEYTCEKCGFNGLKCQFTKTAAHRSPPA